MNRKLQIITGTSAASILVLAALAQDPPIPRTDLPNYTRERIPNAQRADRLNGAAKASEVIGMTVQNYQDEKLGKVEDLALDVESGRIVQVILSTSGFLGIGDTLTAVPPGALHHDVAHKVLHLDANQEKLKSAPQFEMSKWAESSDSEHLSTVYRHYGQEPTLTFIQRGDAVPAGQRNPDAQLPKDAPRIANSSANTISTRNADGTWDKDRISGQRQSMIPASRLAQVQKASKIIGTSVKNLQDEKLGDVDNILLDLSSGRIVAVIISSGGFLGMGDELSAIPPTAFRFTAARDTLQLDASKEMLGNAPHFKANQWPDFDQPGYAHGVYRAYRVEPYFTTNVTTGLDATRRNIRDRDERTSETPDQR